MTLPPLDIPITLALPFEIPLLAHPAAVHFAVALPVIILLLEISNMFFRSTIEVDNVAFKRRALSVTSLLLSLLLVGIYFIAFFTGKVDGSEAGPLLSSEGLGELKAHKLIGTYLVYGSIVLLALKAFAMLVSRTWARLLFMLLLVGFIAATFKQGKDGGELVYKYGANNQAVLAHEDTIDDLTDEVSDFKEEMATLKEEATALKEAAAELQKKLDDSKAVSGASIEAVQEVQENLTTTTPAAVEEAVVEEAVAQEAPESEVPSVEEATTTDVKEVVESAATDVQEAVEAAQDTIETH
jgi:uncharacterized membrane protein